MSRGAQLVGILVVVTIIVGVAVFLHHGGEETGTTTTSTTRQAVSSSITTTSSTAAAGSGKKLVVFCAGSLYIPLQKLATIYEQQHPGVEVIIEPSGSVKAVRKVTELGRRCDVMALADYRLIPECMIPNYAKWYIAFATNQIVLCYTGKSRGAEEINSSNWLEILAKPDTKYGFSNPNDDPCGYRAVTVLGLACLLYNDSSILEKLVLSKTNMQAEMVNGTLHIKVPGNLEIKEGSDLEIRSKSVDLIALLETGALDYAFEYKSVAVQHNLSFVELPPQLNLGDPAYKEIYSRVVIHILYGSNKEKAVAGAPIVYGVTIPSTAENIEGAKEFIKLLLSDTGRKVFEEHGQPFLEKPLYSEGVPGELKG